MPWFAIQVTTGHEKKIKKYLKKQSNNGFNTVNDIVIPTKEKKYIMPGYLFIHSHYWPQLYVTSSKVRVLGTVSEDEVEKYRENNADPVKPKPSFRKGDNVTIVSGSFQGLAGVIKKGGMNHSQVEFFDGEVVISAGNEQLRKVEDSISSVG